MYQKTVYARNENGDLVPVEITQKSTDNNSTNDMTTNNMFSGIVDKYKSQFIPQKEENVKMSLTGLVCVPVDNGYVGIDKDNNLISFPIEMTVDIPVYSISKSNASINVGDIIRNNKNFAKVIDKNPDGSLKTLSFSGYTHNKKEVKDFIIGQSTTRVLINMFNFDDSTGFNPIFFAAANGDNVDVKSLLMLSMTPQGKNLFSNTGGSFNPMMLMMLDKDKQNGSSNLMETMMIMSMMQGNNPFNQMTQK